MPGVIAHMAGNLPFRGMVETTVLASMLVLVMVQGRVVRDWAVSVWRDVIVVVGWRRAAEALVIVALLFALLKFAPISLTAVAALMLGAALWLESRDRGVRPAALPD